MLSVFHAQAGRGPVGFALRQFAARVRIGPEGPGKVDRRYDRGQISCLGAIRNLPLDRDTPFSQVLLTLVDLPERREILGMTERDFAQSGTYDPGGGIRSEEHTSELQSLMRIS